MTETLKIPIYQPALERFKKLIKEDRLAHAYLFVGPAFSGKFETALGLAKLINCPQGSARGFCDECASCTKINNGNHPDVQAFEAITKEEEDEGLVNPKPQANSENDKSRSIRINQIRHIGNRSQLRAFEAAKKVFIIKNIEDLTDQAANAFLKTLEEPVSNSLIILTAVSLDKVLDTVKSRCHIIPFFPLENSRLEERLMENYRMESETAHFLAYFHEGSLGKAAGGDSKELFNRKNEVIDNFILRGNELYLQQLAASKDKKRIKELLSILLSWFRDLTLIKSGAGEARLINRDRLSDLNRFQEKFTFDELEKITEEIVNTCRSLEDNFNIKIALAILRESIWRK